MDACSASLRVAAKDFNTEEGERTTEGHGEGIYAPRAKRCFLPPWFSVVLRTSSVLNSYKYRGHH
jgi:hypothetical protein